MKLINTYIVICFTKEIWLFKGFGYFWYSQIYNLIPNYLANKQLFSLFKKHVLRRVMGEYDTINTGTKLYFIVISYYYHLIFFL